VQSKQRCGQENHWSIKKHILADIISNFQMSLENVYWIQITVNPSVVTNCAIDPGRSIVLYVNFRECPQVVDPRADQDWPA